MKNRFRRELHSHGQSDACSLPEGEISSARRVRSTRRPAVAATVERHRRRRLLWRRRQHLRPEIVPGNPVHQWRFHVPGRLDRRLARQFARR